MEIRLKGRPFTEINAMFEQQHAPSLQTTGDLV